MFLPALFRVAVVAIAHVAPTLATSLSCLGVDDLHADFARCHLPEANPTAQRLAIRHDGHDAQRLDATKS